MEKFEEAMTKDDTILKRKLFFGPNKYLMRKKIRFCSFSGISDSIFHLNVILMVKTFGTCSLTRKYLDLKSNSVSGETHYNFQRNY